MGLRSFIRDVQKFAHRLSLKCTPSFLSSRSPIADVESSKLAQPPPLEPQPQKLIRQALVHSAGAGLLNAPSDHSLQPSTTQLHLIEATHDFIDLPHALRENASLMELIEQATSIRADRSAWRHNIAHRLRLMEEDQTSPPEDVRVVQEQLRQADEALHEAQIAINDLKALVTKMSSTLNSDDTYTQNNSRLSVDSNSSRDCN